MAKWARLAQRPGISVDRRLFLLLIVELGAAALLIGAALATLARLANERDYMDRYVFSPLVDIGEAMRTADDLHDQLPRAPAAPAAGARGPILRLEAFIERYQRDWETGKSDLPEAGRLRAELQRQGESRLLEEEHEIVGEIAGALRDLARATGMTGGAPADPPLSLPEVARLNRALARLNLLNLRYVQIAYKAFERTHQQVTTFFLVVSAASVLCATLLGLWVRRAIGPRVRRLVEAVQRFRERGEAVPVGDRGGDDLGILARALDLSFRGIAARDAERERFLAVAAHELKTPLTTLKGFAQLALTRGDDPALGRRALAVIDRQSTRLARLVQDLLWSARADAKNLPFHPAPFDLEALARRVQEEVEVACPGHEICLAVAGTTRLFGDAALLEQALWNMLLQAATISADGDRVDLGVNGPPQRARVVVETRSEIRLPDDLGELIEPFATMPFEHGGLRSTGLGLRLVGEIARLHGGSFFLERRDGGRVAAVLDLER